MDTNIFGDHCSVSHIYFRFPQLLIFCPKSCHLPGSSCKDSELFMQAADVCLCVSLVYLAVHACLCVCVCVCNFHLHIRSFCFLWDKPVSSTIGPVRQNNNDISVNPLLPAWIAPTLTIALFVGQCLVPLPSISPQADCHEF